MSAAEEVISSIRRAGADLGVSAGRVRLEGPRRVLTAERRDAIAVHREEVLAILVAEADAAALERLDTALGDDGAEPDDGPPASGTREPEPGEDPELERWVANALAESPEERAEWRQEIIHATEWTAAGKGHDPDLLGDLRALRRVEAAGTCLRCRIPCEADGRFWCDECAAKYERATGGRTR